MSNEFDEKYEIPVPTPGSVLSAIAVVLFLLQRLRLFPMIRAQPEMQAPHVIPAKFILISKYYRSWLPIVR